MLVDAKIQINSAADEYCISLKIDDYNIGALFVCETASLREVGVIANCVVELIEEFVTRCEADIKNFVNHRIRFKERMYDALFWNMHVSNSELTTSIAEIGYNIEDMFAL